MTPRPRAPRGWAVSVCTVMAADPTSGRAASFDAVAPLTMVMGRLTGTWLAPGENNSFCAPGGRPLIVYPPSGPETTGAGAPWALLVTSTPPSGALVKASVICPLTAPASVNVKSTPDVVPPAPTVT